MGLLVFSVLQEFGITYVVMPNTWRFMSIQEIVNFLVDCEYNEDTCLDVTYAALSLFKRDKDCLYAYANSYGPFITHLLEVYGKRLEYSPDKYLIYSGNATLDCGLVNIFPPAIEQPIK